jgi:hypothetical protein
MLSIIIRQDFPSIHKPICVNVCLNNVKKNYTYFWLCQCIKQLSFFKR